MTSEAKFDRQEAIGAWRERAAAQWPSAELEEREARLLAAMEERVDRGMTEEDAYAISAHESGLSDRAAPSTKDASEARHPRPWVAYVIATLLSLIVMFFVECFIASTQSEYKSQVSFELRGQDSEGTPYADSGGVESIDKSDVMTEIEIMRSRDTLAQVVKQLELDDKWGLTPDQAAMKLSVGMQSTNAGFLDFSYSRIVRVGYKGEDAQLTANIANAIASAYGRRKTDLWRAEQRGVLDSLQQAIKAQADKVVEARLKALDLADRYNVVPEEIELANLALREKKAALIRTEIAIAKARGTPEFHALAAELAVAKEVELDERARLEGTLRRMAQCEDVREEYELHKNFLRTMQEAFVRKSAMLTMPYMPLIMHETATVQTRPVRVEFSQIWSKAFASMWPLIMVTCLTIWWWRKWRMARLCADSSTSTTREEEIPWA